MFMFVVQQSLHCFSDYRFWYISLVSCFHEQLASKSCKWSHNDLDFKLDIDVWLVNGHPFKKHINPFEHQFSFEMHDVVEIFFSFFIAYCFLVPIQCYALTKQKHLLPVLLTLCMCMEFVGVILNQIHFLKFAFDGVGIDMFRVVGNFIDNCAQCLFMLLLLLIIKGWTITRMDLSWKERLLVFSVWTTYTLASMALFIWNLVRSLCGIICFSITVWCVQHLITFSFVGSCTAVTA